MPQVTRTDADRSILLPRAEYDRIEALRSYPIKMPTRLREQYKGSLEVGKLGDVVVIDRDILTVSDAELADARVDVTIVGGEVKYER